MNVATHLEGAPIGVLNLLGNGVLRGELYGSDVNPLNVSLKLGTERVYTVFAAGGGRFGGREHYTLGLGLGVHLPVQQRLFVDVDAVASVLNLDRKWTMDHSLYQLRTIAGFQLSPRFALTVGPTLNVQVADEPDTLLPLGQWVISQGHEARVWLGLQVGVRI